tara:strand:- start:13622 stop:14155 length:534 start_codon:yes stop_codon:yes gene_type:complete
MIVTVRPARAADAEALATLAALTFPLACPPHTTEAAKQAFIADNMSRANFETYLADDARQLFVAESGEALLGYTMLVAGEPGDPDVAAAVSARPTIELSKVYVHPDAHGGGVASELLRVSLAATEGTRARSIWLGVNQENARAQRFYGKHGFAVVGTKTFLVGDRFEEDYVMERPLS